MATAEQQRSARSELRGAKGPISLAEFWSRIDPETERDGGRARQHRGASARPGG